MKKFHVLIVDDDVANILEPAIDEFGNNELVVLHTANSQKVAEGIAKKHFLQLALVDPGLKPNDAHAFDGNLVLRYLAEKRPSCERIILTDLSRYQDRNGFAPIAVQLHPSTGFAQGLLIKSDNLNHFRKIVDERTDSWLKNPVVVENSEGVVKQFSQVLKNRNRHTKTVLTTEEIDFLVSSLFGQGSKSSDSGFGVERVVLTPLSRQGFSTASVVKAVCYSDRGVKGIECVIKFAEPSYIRRELHKYSQFVRYRVSTHHRVELLGVSFADNLGAICYNFASVSSLSDSVVDRNPNSYAALSDLFSPHKKGWYAEQCTIRLAECFQESYGTNAVESLTEVRKVGETLNRNFTNAIEQHPSITKTIPMLESILARAIFARTLPGCVVHGDLHCDNVLVGQDNSPLLIDYFSVNDGPRTLDFAILDASIRLLSVKRRSEDGSIVPDPREDSLVIPEILNEVTNEDDVWNSVWHKSNIDPNNDGSWGSISRLLGVLVQRNFENDGLNEQEYAATCLYWALRLFSIEDISLRDKTRLLVWVTALVKVFEKA